MAVDGVADSPLERPQGLFRGFLLREFAEVIRPSGCVVADLGDRRDVHGVVELAVPAGVQPVAFDRPAGRVDGALPLKRAKCPALGKRPMPPVWPTKMAAARGPTP